MLEVQYSQARACFIFLFYRKNCHVHQFSVNGGIPRFEYSGLVAGKRFLTHEQRHLLSEGSDGLAYAVSCICLPPSVETVKLHRVGCRHTPVSEVVSPTEKQVSRRSPASHLTVLPAWLSYSVHI